MDYISVKLPAGVEINTLSGCWTNIADANAAIDELERHGYVCTERVTDSVGNYVAFFELG